MSKDELYKELHGARIMMCAVLKTLKKQGLIKDGVRLERKLVENIDPNGFEFTSDDESFCIVDYIEN